jgi:excinuclease UvrABC ATPase subunit
MEATISSAIQRQARLPHPSPLPRPERRQQRQLLWNGTKGVHGIDPSSSIVEQKSYKIQYRVLASRYRGKTACTLCHGTRLKPEAAT